MFDLLTYEKGCGVLRMLEQHIGPDVFRDGVRTYLKAHAYGNTVTTDLWDALEDASGAPVRDVMDTFILQGGHPLVSLHGDTLSQQPFSLGPVPPARRRPSGRSGACRSPCGRCPTGDEPGAPVRHLVLGTDPDADRGGRTRARGGQRRRLGHVPGRLRGRAPAGARRAPARAHPARAGQPARRHLGHHPGRAHVPARSSWSWRRGSGWSPTRRRGPPSAAALVL